MRPWARLLGVATALACAVGIARAAAADMRRPKKLIQTGWDKPDSERLRAHLEQMEQRPFDGVVVGLRGHIDEAKRCHMRAAFGKQGWQRKWFEPCIANLKACQFQRLTDNFILIGANPGNVDWFDDAGWAEIVDHWRIAAWVVRRSGFRGILFDPEPYTKPWAQFDFAAQPRRDDHAFDAYCEKARQRGRQVIEALADECPDLTLFCYFMNSACTAATGHAEPRRALKTLRYGLYPAFIDGWLDAAPETMTFVDGCERAYRFNSVEEYLEAAVAIKGACQELVSPANRATYRAQVQVSYGIYLDAYWNPKDSEWGRWYIEGEQEPRVGRLRANVTAALRCADEYVWVYGEKFRWWPTPNGRVWEKTWPEALPGIERILRFARDPLDYARTEMARLEKEGKLTNLARNGDFGSATAKSNTGVADDWKEGGCPAGWHAWQEKASKGTFTWDRETGAAGKGSAKAAGVANGCFIQSYAVEPGERYAVRAVRRLEGRGDAWIRVRWQTAEGRWTAQGRDVMVYADGPRDQWAELFGVATVPEGAGKLVLLLGAGGQPTAADAAWFDDVVLFRLE
ncbi:MAG: hypothetical protein ACODAJ_09165 [Planctomycetota bacterium]